MATIFSRIISGEIPAYKIAEDENYLAFLDVRPIAKGHTLVIPKQEVDYIFDMNAEQYSGLMLFAQKIAVAIKQAVPCVKVGVAVIGLEVPHAHVHLVPMNKIGDLNFEEERLTFTAEEYKAIQQSISDKLK